MYGRKAAPPEAVDTSGAHILRRLRRRLVKRKRPRQLEST